MRLRTKTNDFRERLRRPPSDYTQRSVKLRIFIYLAAIMAVLTVVTGCVASYGILRRKPLDILRQIET